MADVKVLECINDAIMQEDVEQLVADFKVDEKLKGSTVMVTGATGLLGGQIVKTLACFNRMKNTDIQIIAYVRNAKKAQDMFGHLVERGDVTVVEGDINEKISGVEKADYIIHAASATSSKYFVTNPVETIKTAIDGTINVLEFAKEKGNLKGMVYLSSLEVYGTPTEGKKNIKEEDYGYIDIINTRSSYSEGKRMVECICASYAAEYQVPVKMARLSQTFGPGVEYNDGRVFAEFARCAIEKKDIVLHTQGNTVRTYCYIKDAVSALLYVMLEGKEGEAYNVTNKDTAISIKDMAQMVADTVGEGKIKIVIDIPKDIASFGYNPEMVICLDSSKLESLGWSATVGLQEMYERMCAGFTK